VGGVDGTLAINLAGALSMSLAAAQSCQGATFTVYLTASADYQTATLGGAGLVSYWRLGEDPSVTDTFTDTPAATLQSHTADSGTGWTQLAGSGSADEIITDANRVRRAGGYAVYHTSGSTGGADYAVQADVHVRSTVAGDMTGVLGRVDTSNPNGTFYYARYQQSDTAWHLMRFVDGVSTDLATSASGALTVGQTYRLRLDLVGTALKLYVNEVLLTSATDGAITAAGRGGLLDGDWKAGTTAATTNATGLHLDNLRVVSNTGTIATDLKGVNPGTFVGGPLLNVPGALAGDSNTAVRFNGTDQYATVTREVEYDYSVEFWFKSTQGLGAGTHWTTGAGLVDSDRAGNWDDFGVSLRADGRIMAGNGWYNHSNNYTIMSAAGGYNDGAWHHVVFTRNRTTTAMVMYADGVSVASGNGATTRSNSTAVINFGRLASGGNYFAGALDEVAVYDTVLSASTIADRYHIGYGS
jgi:hypothetical protein